MPSGWEREREPERTELWKVDVVFCPANQHTKPDYFGRLGGKQLAVPFSRSLLIRKLIGLHKFSIRWNFWSIFCALCLHCARVWVWRIANNPHTRKSRLRMWSSMHRTKLKIYTLLLSLCLRTQVVFKSILMWLHMRNLHLDFYDEYCACQNFLVLPIFNNYLKQK